MPTISEVIKKNHQELESYYKEVIGSSDHDHQERFGNQFTWELARHSVAEELLVYPAFESHLGDRGHNMAEEDRKGLHRVRILVFHIRSTADPAYVRSRSSFKSFKTRNPSNPTTCPSWRNCGRCSPRTSKRKRKAV